MIKVNLLRSLGLSQGAGISAPGEVVAVDLQKQAAMRAIVIVLFPIGLAIYENSTISSLEANLADLTKRAQAIETEKTSFGEAGPKVLKYTKEKEKIEKQAEAIRAVTRNRLRELKALDTLQSLTPPQVWFHQIAIEGSTVKAEGYSNNPEGISALFDSFNNSPFFSQFEPGSQTEETVGGSRVKKFEFRFQIGRPEQATAAPATEAEQ